MDNQIAFDAMNNVMLAAEVLGVDAAYRDSLRRTIDRLPPNAGGPSRTVAGMACRCR